MSKQQTDKTTGAALTNPSNFAACNGGGTNLISVAQEFGLDRSLLTRIKVPSGGGQFWEVDTPEGPESFKALEFIIVSANLRSRSWYRVSIDKATEGDNAPDCSSRDGVIGFGNPTTDESAEQAKYECAGCSFAQWGSDRNGGKGQDCAVRGQLVGFVPGSALPVILSVPRTSLQAFKRYAMGLAGAGSHPTGVVTELTLAKKSSGGNNYSVIEYRKLRMLTGGELTAIGGYKDVLAEAFAD